MTSKVFGFHGDITEGDGTNATLGDFTSYLDHSGSFYLGGGESGASTPSGGYFAWNNNDKSLLISGSNAEVKVDKFFFGAEDTQFLSGSNGNVEISGSNFHLDRDGNVKVSGEITVTNTSDFAGNSFIDDFSVVPSSTNYYINTVNAYLSDNTPDGIPFQGIRVISGQYSTNTTSGFVTKTTFDKDNEPEFVIDIVANGDGTYGNAADFGTLGFTNIGANSDISTAPSTDHITAGFQLAKEEHDGSYYNTINIVEDGSLEPVRTFSEEVGEDLSVQAAWTQGTDTKWRFVIKLKAGGGATYTAFKDGDFSNPKMFHTTTTDFGATTAHTAGVLLNYGSGGNHYIYLENMSVGAGIPQSTTISGNSISTGKIQSTTLTTTAGSELDLDGALFKIGGTGAYTSNNGILLDGPNARFAVGNSGGSYIRFNHTANKLEINTDNFDIDSSGNVTVNGSITVTNPGDFADPGANVTTEAVFEKFGGVSSPIDSTNYYLGNLVQNLVTQTDGGTSFSGIKFEKSGTGNGWNAGFATKTTFTSSLEPIASIDIVLNQGVTGDAGVDQYPPYQMMGFSDIDENADITTTNNFEHITHGIYITRLQNDGSYYNTFQVRENSGAGVGASDYYTVNGITPNGTNGPWVSGQDTFIRFTIQPKQGGGAIYKAFRNGNFLVPIWSYVSSTYEFTGNQSFFWSTYWGESNSNRKELIVDQISIGAAPPAGTVISGDGITAGTIVSTNLNADSGSQLLLDDGSMKMGGTTSPGLDVTSDGFVTVTNLVEKSVEVTNANSGSYFENYSSNTKTRLILDGSLGGDVTMNLTIAVAPAYEINDIQFPANAGSNAIAKLELIVLADGVTFNDGVIASGFSSFAFALGQRIDPGD